MALTLSLNMTDGGIVVDETETSQNATLSLVASDQNDNDTVYTTTADGINPLVPSAFSTYLNSVSITPEFSALSGYTGASGSTGTNLLNISGGTYQDLYFSDADGDLLDGFDSGLQTIDGTAILLYTDTTNNNIVVGRAGGSGGAIVFAAYLEETATGAKLWMITQEPLMHSTGGSSSPDDALTLADHLWVSASAQANFNFGGAPSGQNVFMMFRAGTSDIGVVVTGMDPDKLQIKGVKADTVNTSQAHSTALGTNNQGVDAGEGMVFTFVTTPDTRYTVDLDGPDNLTSTEAGNENNIQFGGVFATSGAKIEIAQATPPNTQTITLKAFTTAKETGTGFADGLLDGNGNPVDSNTAPADEMEYIASVTVYGTDGTTVLGTFTADSLTPNSNGITADFTESDGGNDRYVEITGVKAHNFVEYTVTGTHNRIVIQNTGSGNDTFDIGGLSLPNVQPVPLEIGSAMGFEDDAPIIAGTESGTVDEDGVSGGIAGELLNGDVAGEVVTSSGVLTDIFNAGNDGLSTFGLQEANIGQIKAYASASDALNDTNALTLTSKGDPVVYDVQGDTLWAFVNGDSAGNDAAAYDGNDRAVFKLELTNTTTTGNYTFTLLGQLDHPSQDGEAGVDNSENDIVINLGSILKITDKDGDFVEGAPGVLVITVDDDAPTISANAGELENLVVDESVLGTDDTENYSSTFTPAYGADGAGNVAYSLAVDAGGPDSGLVDTATGSAVLLFQINATTVEGHVGSVGGAHVFTVSVDGTTGVVTLDQKRAVVHDPNVNANDTETLSADNLVRLVATITDKDGDTANATQDIGTDLIFTDDAPTISANAGELENLVVDESVLGTDDTENYSSTFTPAYGADGAGNVAYSLAVDAGGPDSGLIDTATGGAVLLYQLNTTTVEGRVGSSSGAHVFTVSVVGDTGVVTLDQLRAVFHDPNNGPNDTETLTTDNLVRLVATITDKDGDTTSATQDIGTDLIFTDDAPTISANAGDLNDLVVDESVLGTDDSEDYSGTFTPDFKADGAGAIGYTLAVDAGGPNSGLVDTATGSAVLLYQVNATTVAGRVVISGVDTDVFTVSVVGSGVGAGTVTLDQKRAVFHDPNNGPNDTETLTTDNLVRLVATITDKDGDTTSATQDIGTDLIFTDDAPTISANAGDLNDLVVDESVLATDDSEDYSSTFTSDYKADGAGTIGYTLAVDTGTASGLIDTATGSAVLLYQVNTTTVEGRVGSSSGAHVFTVSVVGDTGVVTLDQLRAVFHDPNNGPNDTETLTADNLVRLVATITDKDGDATSATQNIGTDLIFTDDAPTLAFGNLIGTGSLVPQFGYWSKDAKADGLGAAGLDIVLNSFQLVRPDGTTDNSGTFTFTELAGSPNGSGAYLFGGKLTADFDNNSATAPTSVDFTLTAYANGTYALDLVQGFKSQIVLDTSQGKLIPGGPDFCQTLLIPGVPGNDPPPIPSPSEEVVFFSAKATATATQIFEGITIGLADRTEADLQDDNPLGAYLDTARGINVSTSGIGVANNVFQGDNAAAITIADESFVVNTESLLTAMRVFIDNSVAGYNMGTEDLYYRIYYSDGTTSDLTEVNSTTPVPPGMTVGSLNTVGMVYFDIVREGTKLIDAVQLVMGRGDIKIPVIQFTQELEGLASDVKLAFSATVTDKDGDTATSAFVANLFANEPEAAASDYLLFGTSGSDAFNVDLSATENIYQVLSGFGAGDKLVLVGDASASYTIDNTGANSLVTIVETGTQTTTVELIGIDLFATDVVLL